MAYYIGCSKCRLLRSKLARFWHDCRAIVVGLDFRRRIKYPSQKTKLKSEVLKCILMYFIIYELSLARRKGDVWNQVVLPPLARLNLSCYTARLLKNGCVPLPCSSRISFYELNLHCSFTAFETGLKLMHVCRVSIRQKVNKFTNSSKKACLHLCQFLFSNFRHLPASIQFENILLQAETNL